MNRMSKYLFFLLLVFSTSAYGQTSLKKVKEWKTKEVSQIAIDRLGNFFVQTKKGTIKKYGVSGEVLASLKKSKGDLIEPWYHPSIFIYDRTRQQYHIYGRNFENKRTYDVEPAAAIEPFLICPTHDNKHWILDKADYSIKKINPLTGEVMTEFVLLDSIINTNPSFTYLREYQNLIFLLDSRSGVWILNTFGNLITKIEINNPGNFNFFGNQLYYLQHDEIIFYNLLSEEEYRLTLPEKNNRLALVSDERILTVTHSNKIVLYEYQPPAE